MVKKLRLKVGLRGNGFLDLDPDDCFRVIEIGGATSLFTLGAAILEAFDFQLDHSFGFYDNLKEHYDSRDIHTTFADFLDDDDPTHGKSVKKTKLSTVFQAGTSRLFLFDYGDDWMFEVHCLAHDIDGRAGAQIVEIEGEAPPQYPDYED